MLLHMDSVKQVAEHIDFVKYVVAVNVSECVHVPFFLYCIESACMVLKNDVECSVQRITLLKHFKLK